jgi:hypothetical protein
MAVAVAVVVVVAAILSHWYIKPTQYFIFLYFLQS